MDNKEFFLNFFRQRPHLFLSEEKQIEFLDFLENSDFFEAPASTEYYSSMIGGLCYHALTVGNTIINLNNILGLNRTQEELLKIVYIYYLGKINLFETYQKAVKVYDPDGNKHDDGGNFYWSHQQMFKIRDQKDRDIHGNNGFNSFMIAKKYFKLTDEEIITLCNCQNVGKENCGEIPKLLSRYNLLSLLHSAEFLSVYVRESSYTAMEGK